MCAVFYAVSTYICYSTVVLYAYIVCIICMDLFMYLNNRQREGCSLKVGG